MSKVRLQVLMDPADYRELQQFARRQKTSVGACVRHVLAEAIRRGPRKSVAEKLAALDKAMQFNGPTGDIEQINAQIEQGYLSGEWPR